MLAKVQPWQLVFSGKGTKKMPATRYGLYIAIREKKKKNIEEAFDCICSRCFGRVWCCYKPNPPPSEPSSHQWWKWCRVKMVCCLRRSFRSRDAETDALIATIISLHNLRPIQQISFKHWNLQLLWSPWATSWFTTALHLWHTKIEDNQLGCNLGEPTKDVYCLLHYIIYSHK